jgi:hypothetical protein
MLPSYQVGAEALRDANEAMRDLGSLLIHQLATQFGPRHFVPVTHECLSILCDLLRGQGDLLPQPVKTRNLIEQVLLNLLPVLDMATSYGVILDWLAVSAADPQAPTADVALAGTALKALKSLIASDSSEYLADRAEFLTDALTATVRHPSADVRKATVLCIVELNLQRPEQMAQLLTSRLNASELRIVSIYVLKRQERQNRLATGV